MMLNSKNVCDARTSFLWRVAAYFRSSFGSVQVNIHTIISSLEKLHFIGRRLADEKAKHPRAKATVEEEGVLEGFTSRLV